MRIGDLYPCAKANGYFCTRRNSNRPTASNG
jgi:hypothetical protein